MKNIVFRSNLTSVISLLICFAFVIQITGCGTLMYPERRGLPRDPAQLDVKVVIMDGLLLFLFVVPGVVAYAVDFATGCIYLPPGQIVQNVDDVDPAQMRVIQVAPDDLSLDTLPAVIEQHTGLPVMSHSGEMRIFHPGSADVNIAEELELLLNGETPQSPGRWYANGEIALVADIDGRITAAGVVVPQEARLAGE